MTGPHTNIDNHSLLSDDSMGALELMHQPFTETAADGELFEDDTARSIIADINDALYGSDDVLMILGTPGSGRSILLRQLANNSQSRIACFSVKGTSRFDTAHLFASVLDAFKTPVPVDLKDALDALVPSLQGTFERYNRLSTIVLDDADQVPVDELTKLLSSVLYLNGQEEPLLRVLLSSVPEFEERLPDALPQGAEIQYASLVIDPMPKDRAKNYLEFRLNQAGYFDNFPFTDRDMQSIMEESKGYPRALNSAAALNLNAQHGDLAESSMPRELVENRGGGRFLKMLLGGLACLMIVAGLFLFTKNDGDRGSAAETSEEYRTVETVPVAAAESEPVVPLEIVPEATSQVDVPTNSETDSEASSETTDTATTTTEADNTSDATVAENQLSPNQQEDQQEDQQFDQEQELDQQAGTSPTQTDTPEPGENEIEEPANSNDDLVAGNSGNTRTVNRSYSSG